MRLQIFISVFLIVTVLITGCIEGSTDTAGMNESAMELPTDAAEINESLMELQVITADMQSGIYELSLALENQSMALENVSDATIELDKHTGSYKMNESSINLPKIAYASGQFEASARHSQEAQEYFASAQGNVSNSSLFEILSVSERIYDYTSVTHFVKHLADAGVNFTAELQKPEPDPWWSVAYHGLLYTWLEQQDAAFDRAGINRTDLHAYLGKSFTAPI